MLGSNINQDLVWTLGGNTFPEATFGFLKRFEAALCLFSGTVSQLYSNYEIVHFGHDGRKLVALPNQFAAHDTFNNIESDAVEPTGLYILPTEVTDRGCMEKGLRLVYRCSKTGKPRSIPLQEGLEKVRKKFLPKEPFLPVMINKDLRSLNGKIPAMHLHRLRVAKLDNISDLMKMDISRTVEDKMNAFYKVS
ncbi:hypothetical protein DWB84_02505 [Saccharophagus sp. K07]|jgi:hypothetical protein|uniref:hypothetical protein n=1 Tax=Saccharophagus sp. K07 TaxID=2283636 RepID=UPI0016529427|nr:hypothetical protein [Saccharophagus sp. K07]MBC6904341.1 hypothetical protein [Saccharophagus sp. K07]